MKKTYGSAGDDIRSEIRLLVQDFYKEVHKNKQFIPGTTPIPSSGKVFDEQEMVWSTEAVLEFWLTEGEMAEEFKKNLQLVMGRRYAIPCNSGSSANLLAITALAKKGMKVITPAVGFPTTLNPIIQNGMIPVFIDVNIGTDVATYVPSKERIQEAIKEHKAELLVLPHTLGNFSPLKDFGVPVIYDSCDAYGGYLNKIPVTSFGDMATLSFYPAHGITTGEGGAVLTDDSQMKLKLDSLCGWSRDCWCKTGHDNTCGKRYGWQFPDLPFGYDHKYVYSSIGYNLKMTDLQAAIGIPQLRKLPDFVQIRQENFKYYLEAFQDLTEHFILPQKSYELSEPAWFGFPLTIRPGSPINRLDLLRFLESKKIGTRLFFGSNLLRQPAYKDIEYEVSGNLNFSDLITTNSFWIGVYPGITHLMREYVMECFDEFIKGV